jgi:hypothetical protein
MLFFPDFHEVVLRHPAIPPTCNGLKSEAPHSLTATAHSVTRILHLSDSASTNTHAAVFFQVLMERLRSRRALSKDMRNKLRKALQTLPPRSSEFPRSLNLQTTDGIEEVILGLKSSLRFLSLIVLEQKTFRR